MKDTVMKGIGVVLLLIGCVSMYDGYQASQSVVAKLNNFIGNSAGNHDINTALVGELVFALVGAYMLFVGNNKKSD